ncbi:MAG: hypothetical protein IPL61_20715 [Myxococcales bacterium]|nr:hypothetical protein [Myxococcales bacterium]
MASDPVEPPAGQAPEPPSAIGTLLREAMLAVVVMLAVALILVVGVGVLAGFGADDY